MAVAIEHRTKFSIFIQAIRIFSLTAAVIPVVTGSALALYYPGNVDWYLLPVIIICSLLYQSSTNMMNDYYDYKKGVDKPHTYGSSRVLVDHVLEPRQLIIMAFVVMVIGFLLGLTLVVVRGLPMLILGIIGALGGYFYSGYPKGYKYFALGDIMVFLLMGPLMVIGSYYALTGHYYADLWIVSLPIGALVLSILQSNNHRDIIDDSAAKIKTVSILLGHKISKIEYFVLVTGAYVCVGIVIIAGMVTPFTAVVALALPVAVQNLIKMKKSRPDSSSEIAMLDAESAKHHLLFGLLYSIGMILGYYI